MSGLRAKKPLVSKRPLKRGSKPLKSAKLKAKQRTKQKVPTITKLRRIADREFGHYVRLRDAELVGNIEWQGQCISCERTYRVRWYDEDKNKWRWGDGGVARENKGHYIGCSNYFLRYDEMNVNLQCVGCNKWKSANIMGTKTTRGYRKGLNYKYGDGTWEELERLAEANKAHPLKRQDLEQVIKASKEYLEWAYEQEAQLHE